MVLLDFVIAMLNSNRGYARRQSSYALDAWSSQYDGPTCAMLSKNVVSHRRSHKISPWFHLLFDLSISNRPRLHNAANTSGVSATFTNCAHLRPHNSVRTKVNSQSTCLHTPIRATYAWSLSSDILAEVHYAVNAKVFHLPHSLEVTVNENPYLYQQILL